MWFPALLVTVAMVLQVFGYVWAREAAQGAARYGAYAARVYGGTDAAGQRQAQAYLSEVAGTLVEDPQILVTRTATTVTVTIRARPRQMPLPLAHLREFSVRASGPIEEVRL